MSRRSRRTSLPETLIWLAKKRCIGHDTTGKSNSMRIGYVTKEKEGMMKEGRVVKEVAATIY